MQALHPIRSRALGALLLGAPLLGTLAGCGSQAEKLRRMPFHVAVVTPSVQQDERTAQRLQGSPTEFKLAIDAERLAARLEQRLTDSFVQVTPLKVAFDDPASVAKAAADAGADMVLVTELTFTPAIGSSLNNQFWPNLALFAIGGPFGWFVPDRSYYCNLTARGALHDVSALATANASVQSPAVCEVSRPANETSLNFLDRANGVGSYLLSCLVPAGFLSTDNATVQTALREELVDQISKKLADALFDEAGAIEQWREVAFSVPRLDARVEGGSRAVVGEIWMDRNSRVRELAENPLRYRFGNGPYQAGEANARTVDAAADPATARTIYDFRIPLPAAYRGPLQLEIAQADLQGTKRTFTYLVD